ncbi:anti-sigma F factor [uncultured Tyzzerella sp.]|uniref:anti-sigma F factor n=1 Tax=uncultured Tyzzerella sp. TaxID=2321398 RepID=UPI0029433BFB|nr:anti-sigma F factor [uncultured Tyzzerella sp.]
MQYDNKISLILDANSKNEAFARVSVAAFATQLDPTLEQLEDIKMAVSEAVTNAIIHGYEGIENGKIYIDCKIARDILYIDIEDKGRGIENLEKAMEPLYTSKPHMERSGMGFTVMEAFMDNIKVVSEVGKGTKIYLEKKINKN